MTEKDELVSKAMEAYHYGSAKRPSQHTVFRDGMTAAIASIRPTIVEEVLRDLLDKAEGFDYDHDTNYVSFVIKRYAKSHGLDLTQDGER